MIAELRSYVIENIPDLSACGSYRSETRNRRIIMWLNYHGMEKLSMLLLGVKSRM